MEVGDYVSIALPNGIDFYVAFWAALKVGATPQPLSWRLPVAERQAILDLARSKLLVGVDDGVHPGFATLPPGFEPDPSISDEPLPEVVSPCWKAPTSGGSTGRPKIIRVGSGAEGSPPRTRSCAATTPRTSTSWWRRCTTTPRSRCPWAG